MKPTNIFIFTHPASTEGRTELEILVPEELFRRFQEAAAAQGKSPGDLLAACIRRYIERHAPANNA